MKVFWRFLLPLVQISEVGGTRKKEKGDLIGMKHQQMFVDAVDDRSIRVCSLCDLCRGWSPGCWPRDNNEGCTHKKETMCCSKGTTSCATHVITVKLWAVLRDGGFTMEIGQFERLLQSWLVERCEVVVNLSLYRSNWFIIVVFVKINKYKYTTRNLFWINIEITSEGLGCI